MKSQSSIYLLGDAILDNYHWLDDQNKDLKKEITSLGFTVNNYAVDDTKVTDIINGIKPKDLYVKTRNYSYPVDEDGKMYPMRLLSRSINPTTTFASIYGNMNTSTSTRDNMAVISMGGNDLRANLLRIVLGADTYMNSVLTKEFIASYEKIITDTQKICDKIVLISIYLPYLGPGSSYALYSSFAKPIMHKWHKFLYGIAEKHNIPVIDLGKTFNPQDRSHYGKVETYPSNKSNKCIADCISHIYNNYDGYHIYYAPNCDSSKITFE